MKILRFAATLLMPALLAAQNGSMRVTIPSPTAASLGKFGDVPVSLYTGTPDITVPIFAAQGRTLELPIALKYHGGGIKTEEIGSWVGIGWTLEAGGTITRTVHGLVDEKSGGYYSSGSALYGSNWPTPSGAFLQNIRQGLQDGEPDQFFFDFAGRSGQFVMGPINSSGTIDIETIPRQDLLIQPNFSSPSGGDITSFVITTEDGSKYTFGQAEVTTDYTLVGTTIGAHYGETHNSSWHLTQVQSPGGDVITLTYSSEYDTRHRMAPYWEHFDQVSGTTPACRSDVQTDNQFGYASFQLATITTAKQTIIFSPGSSLRTDALSPTGGQQEPRLDHITVQTPTGTVLRTFQLAQDYSTGRLTLKSVQEKDPSGNLLPPYAFTYDATQLPDYLTYSVDHWGYYNGAQNSWPIPPGTGFNNVAFPGADRSPSLSYARAGTLTGITYPTGGSDQFTWELNDYGAIANGDQPVRDSIIEHRSDSWVNPVDTFSIVGPSVLATISTWQSPDNCAGIINPPCPTEGIDGVGNWQQSGVYYINMAPGLYTMRTNDMGTYPNGFSTIIVDLDYKVPAKIAGGGGGLRIAEVRSMDAMGATTYHEYKYRLQSDTTTSSGIINTEPFYGYTFSSPECSYFSRSSTSRMHLGDGPGVAYRDVAVWRGQRGEFGKTWHHFRTYANAADPTAAGSWPYLRQTTYDWQRGQDTSSTIYDSLGVIQHHNASTNQFLTTAPTYRSFHGMALYSMAVPEGGGIDNEYFYGVDVYNPFEVISAWTYMDTDTTVAYDQAGANKVTSVKTYVYGNPAHLQPTQIIETNSDGTQRITRMTYPQDYDSTGTGNAEAIALGLMVKTAHMHNEVIEKWTIRRVNGVDAVVEGTLTTYKQYPSGQILPYQHFVLTNPGVIQ